VREPSPEPTPLAALWDPHWLAFGVARGEVRHFLYPGIASKLQELAAGCALALWCSPRFNNLRWGPACVTTGFRSRTQLTTFRRADSLNQGPKNAEFGKAEFEKLGLVQIRRCGSFATCGVPGREREVCS